MNYLKLFESFEVRKGELIHIIQNLKDGVVEAMNYANSNGSGINLSFHYGVITLGELFNEIDKLNPSTDDNTLISICNEINLLGKYQSVSQYEWMKRNPLDRTSNYDILKYEFSKKIIELIKGTKWDISNRERIISEEDIKAFFISYNNLKHAYQLRPIN